MDGVRAGVYRSRMDLVDYLRIQVHANALANLRLHNAMAGLSQADFHAPRTGFFPSLAATLNHILAVDLYYIGVLRGDAGIDSDHWDRCVAAGTLAELAARQRASDARLVAFCNGLDAAGCERVVEMPRSGGRVQRDRAAHVLAHLLNHQTHHRGQAHAMLSGSTVTPPQLDEFMMPSEAHLRSAEMAALGWREDLIYRP
jgi:uncharacterized damage-inducible protein DinB